MWRGHKFYYFKWLKYKSQHHCRYKSSRLRHLDLSLRPRTNPNSPTKSYYTEGWNSTTNTQEVDRITKIFITIKKHKLKNNGQEGKVQANAQSIRQSGYDVFSGQEQQSRFSTTASGVSIDLISNTLEKDKNKLPVSPVKNQALKQIYSTHSCTQILRQNTIHTPKTQYHSTK